MKTQLIIILLVSLISFSIEARPKKKAQSVQEFTEWTYTQDPFTVTRTTMDEAFITSTYADGIYAPLPFRVIRGELSDQEFRDTLIFITDNLSEAFNH
jgi:hypothetical protein